MARCSFCSMQTRREIFGGLRPSARQGHAASGRSTLRFRPCLVTCCAKQQPHNQEHEVLLLVLRRLQCKGTSENLRQFIRMQDKCTTVAFMQWVADKYKHTQDVSDRQARSAVALALVGAIEHEHMQELGNLCEQLVCARELLGPRFRAHNHHCIKAYTKHPCADVAEQTSLEAAHADVLHTFSLEAATSQSSALQRQENPTAYAAALSRSITGAPVVTEGFSPVYDLILQAAPPMALTPQGVQEGFEKAAVLAEDVKQRKKRTLAALMGRVQLGPGEADAILAGPPAGRVLDFLLELPSAAERAGSLSDCFTPPAGGPGSRDEGGEDDHNGEELLWCTPRQLLAEVERRLLPPASHPAQRHDPGAVQPLQLQGPGVLRPQELAAALQHLKAEITEHWLYSFPAGMQQR